MERTPATAQNSSIDDTSTGNAQAEVERLIAAGKCKQAVELAKQEHKRCATPQTERRLAQAYLARIEQFQNKGMAKDAQTLLALVRQRFPEQRDGLMRLEVRSAAANGLVNDLVAPLASGTAAPEVRAHIEEAIRQDLIDLPWLAQCQVLPADHPLRIAAGAIWRAFEAVTSGPVGDEQIALPEVTRRSPLAGWKMLVRAIAAFYRADDGGCRQALDAIPADAAVARFAPVLRAMMERTPLSGPAGALQVRVVGDDRALRTALERIEKAFRWTDLTGLTRSIREAVRACATSRPELNERLRQHISVACVLQDVPVEEVVSAMGASRKDAYFWRLLARACELEGSSVLAALYWERFLRHAVAERIFAERSMEAAMVYLRAAELLRGLSQPELADARRRLSERGVFAPYYRDQPPEIAVLAPRSEDQIVQTALSPGWLFDRSAEIHPVSETFRQWWSWAQEAELADRWKEDLARRWHEKQPQDPQPLLILSTLAERRNALNLAMKHLSKAEAIDALNPQVRQARVRLTLATMWRHFQDNKPHLVEHDLSELGALPGMSQGDRGAFVAALRAAWHALRHDEAALKLEIDAVMREVGVLAGSVILESVHQMARLPRECAWPHALAPALPDPHEVAHAEARTIRLSLELGLRTLRPAAWDAIIDDVLRERGCPLSQAEILAIGRAAISRDAHQQAHLASSAGLATASNPAAIARFLLLRAQSLAAPWAQKRSAQCLGAAMQLARQTHDSQLLQEVFAQVDRHPAAKRAIASSESGRGLSDDVLADVLKHERDAPNFPRDRAEAERHLAIQREEKSFDRGPFGPLPFAGDDDDDETGDEGMDDSHPLDLPKSLEVPAPELLDLLEPLLRKNGRLPTPAELMNTNPQLLLQLLAAMSAAGTDSELLNELLNQGDDQPSPGSFGGFFGRKKPKRKQRR
jgi:hypothetical protein